MESKAGEGVRVRDFCEYAEGIAARYAAMDDLARMRANVLSGEIKSGVIGGYDFRMGRGTPVSVPVPKGKAIRAIDDADYEARTLADRMIATLVKRLNAERKALWP